jgi:hypothetical protein
VVARRARLSEINQALHEFIGEVAELGQVIRDAALDALMPGQARIDLIDEIGDIFFCGCWLLDAYGRNNLAAEGVDPNDILDPLAQARARQCQKIAHAVQEGAMHVPFEDTDLVFDRLSDLSWNMLIGAGLLANSFKKFAYRRKHRDLEDEAHAVRLIFAGCAELLAMAGATVTDALCVNITKIDRRRPRGYEAPAGDSSEPLEVV